MIAAGPIALLKRLADNPCGYSDRGRFPDPKGTFMAGRIEARLKELGIVLPAGSPPIANYVPYVTVGSLVFVSGQVPRQDGKFVYQGKLGAGISVPDAQKAARLCGIALIGHMKAACGGDLDRVKRVVKLGGFVSSTAEFQDHPQVVNGASDLMVEVFDEAGRHARFAVGVADLPANVCVEVDGVFEIA
jgi:enamine deaminase RidA (YjgF/YER057c/UK114 family)